MGDAENERIERFHWVGSEEAYLDQPTLAECGSVAIGRYGGNTAAGARRNDDGALVWCAADGAWEFAVVLDAHYSAESAELILTALEEIRPQILAALAEPLPLAFQTLQQTVLALFTDAAFRARCREVYGEASCLMLARKGAYLWWFAVGDCLCYLLHPETARLGQFVLNQRVFFQWIGQRNTFDERVPGYATGTQRLYRGTALIALATDGVFESVPLLYERPDHLLALLDGDGDALAAGVQQVLAAVHNADGRDSATLLAWRVSSR